MDVPLIILALVVASLLGILGWQIYFAANPHKRRDSNERK